MPSRLAAASTRRPATMPGLNEIGCTAPRRSSIAASRRRTASTSPPMSGGFATTWSPGSNNSGTSICPGWRSAFRRLAARASRMFATLTPLRFAGGRMHTFRRKRRWRIQRLYDPDGREMLYILTFYLPRFLDLPLREKLTTVLHELWHVGPEFDGDVRRLGAAVSPTARRKSSTTFTSRPSWTAGSPSIRRRRSTTFYGEFPRVSRPARPRLRPEGAGEAGAARMTIRLTARRLCFSITQVVVAQWCYAKA